MRLTLGAFRKIGGLSVTPVRARPRPPCGLFRALRSARARGQLRRHPALRRTATAAPRRYAPGRQTFCCADQCNPSVGLQGSWAEPCLSRSLIPEKLDGLATGTLPELKLVKFSSVSIRVLWAIRTGHCYSSITAAKNMVLSLFQHRRVSPPRDTREAAPPPAVFRVSPQEDVRRRPRAPRRRRAVRAGVQATRDRTAAPRRRSTSQASGKPARPSCRCRLAERSLACLVP